MENERLRALLEAVRTGELDLDSATREIGKLAEGSHSSNAPLADLGYAHVDLHRRERCGFPEVVFCEGKSPQWVEGVIRKLAEARQDCLATRLNEAQSEHLAHCFPEAEQNRLARTFWLPAKKDRVIRGRVVVITAGTSDLAVAEEALVTIRAVGADASLLADVGVAGIHRLLRHQAEFNNADAVVVVAGMEGALPSVVGGLVPCPVIAVPTSVGYGASFGGLSALLTMLNSCSAGVVVVNIDSGFKGGYVAALIARASGKRCD
jgi:pyridinium-3,5-biscarboxylic acid mononucleotide synthase